MNATADRSPRRTLPTRRHGIARPRFRPSRLAAAAMLGLVLPLATAQTLPTGGQVVHGQASIVTQGQQMTVTSTRNAILNWQSFSIGAGQGVRFDQPSASSQVLNRVLGKDPTAIFGQLSSNGRVWLLNPNGVLFGPTARIDVAGLVASTLPLGDADWQAQRFSLLTRTAERADTAAVVNQGEIRSTFGGRVALVGGAGGVRNEGLIEAPGGQVLLSAGASVDLSDSTLPDIAVRVKATAGDATNLGRIVAAGGRIDLQGAMVNQDGLVRADAIGAGRAGEVVLHAADTALLRGQTSASAESGTGGRIALLGAQVGLLEGSQVDASGALGGGRIEVGGGLQGLDRSIVNSRAVYMAPGATLRADATALGDGGRIIMWSDEATRAFGTLSARGGPRGGDGGFIETSGGWLDARPRSVATDAPLGKSGMWLLDPVGITITDGSNPPYDNVNSTPGPDFTPTAEGSIVATQNIVAALNAGNNVTVTTASSGSTSTFGDIYVSSANIVANPPQPVSLTLDAWRNVEFDSSLISSSGSPLTLTVKAARGGMGYVWVQGTDIFTHGGNLTLGGHSTNFCGANSCVPGFTGAIGGDAGYSTLPGVSVLLSTLDAGGGIVRLIGASAAESGSAKGVSVGGSSVVRGHDVLITGITDTSGTYSAYGVYLDGRIEATHSIALDGHVEVTSGGGYASYAGVRIANPAELWHPMGAVAGAGMHIAGSFTSHGGSGGNPYSIDFDGNLQAAPQAVLSFVGDGAEAYIDGSSGFAASSASSLTFSGSGFLSIYGPIAAPASGVLSIKNTGGLNLIDGLVAGSSMDIDVGSADATVGGAFFCSLCSAGFTATDLSIKAGRLFVGTESPSSLLQGDSISLRADEVHFGSQGQALASNPGLALLVAGRSGNASVFQSLGAPGSLSTPNGHWQIWVNDPSSSGDFNPGSLVNDYRQYSATFGTDTPQGNGNGFLFGITPLATLTGTGSITKVYDGTSVVTTPITPDSLIISGLLAGDSISGGVQPGQLIYGDRNAGTGIPIEAYFPNAELPVVDTNGKPVFGYGLTSALFGDITPRAVSVTGATASNKVYDGTRTATLTGGSFTGLVGNETLGFQPGSAQFDTKDVGSGKTVSGSLVLVDGSNGGRASNYMLSGSGTISAQADITPKEVTLGALTVQPKTYDGSTVAAVTGGQVNGTVAGETLVVTVVNANFADKNAGVGKTVNASATLGDGTGLASNYMLAGGNTASGLGDILPRNVTVSGIAADHKVYDGTRTATVTGGSISGLVGGETLALTRGGVFDTADAGQGKTVTATLTLGDGGSGGLAANYRISGGGVLTTVADITPRTLSLSGLTAQTREYDGTRAATLDAGTLSGLVGHETLNLVTSSALFDTGDAGSGKTVTATLALADGSGKAANYRLPGSGPVELTGTILPKGLTVSGASAADKVYDGSTHASVTVQSVSGLVGSETLGITPSGRFADPHAGQDKPVQIELTLADGSNGGRAANYTLGSSPLVQADITRRPITLSGVTAADKVYDGTRTAAVGAGSLVGLVPGESLTLATEAQFADKNVGAGKAVSGSFTIADGVGGRASDYEYDGPNTFSGVASITPRPLAVSGATAASKVYDATTAAVVGGWTLSGVLPGEQVAVAAGSGRFDNANVGAGKAVTATATAIAGADAGNYLLGSPSFVTSASITPASLTYNADAALRAVGGSLSGLTGTVSGFQGGDNLGNATTGSLRFSTTADSTSPEGRYPILGSGLASANYLFSQATANSTALTLIAVPPDLALDTVNQQPQVPQLLGSLLPPHVVSAPESHRAADVLPAMLPSPEGNAFRTLDLGNMPLDATAALLNARERYKKAIFADALAELEKNPGLADLPTCQTVEQAAAGNCLVTEGIKVALREHLARTQVAAASPPAATATPPAVAPAPVTASPAAPAAVAAAPAAPAAAAPRPPAAARPSAEPRIQVPTRRNVRTASLPQIQRKLALVIGIDDYADPTIPKLDNAVADAVAVAEVLDKSLGYDTVVVRNGSKQAIVAAFNQLAAQVGPTDSVVVYYAGHGEQLEKAGLGYWQPANAVATRPETWLSNADIGKLLGQFSAGQVALISDSCFSGSLVSDERIRGIGQGADPATLLSRRAVVVMSSGGNEPVFDSGKNGHSTFAWNLMRSLEKVSTWRPGNNVFEQVRFAVAKELPQRPQYGAARLSGHQAGTDYLFEQRQLDAVPR